jgi:hypothetical protein
MAGSRAFQDTSFSVLKADNIYRITRVSPPHTSQPTAKFMSGTNPPVFRSPALIPYGTGVPNSEPLAFR